MDTAEGETQGLRDARQTAKDNLEPILISQGADDFYLKKGIEYVAYTNWNSAKENLEAAQEVLDEIDADYDDLETRYYDA